MPGCGAGTSALIDKSDPFDHLFRTITALLRSRLLAQTAPRYLATLALTAVDDLGRERIELFGVLTSVNRVFWLSSSKVTAWIHRERGIRLNLHRSITDQGDTSEVGRELAAGCSRNGAACRLVIRGPLWDQPPDPSSGRRRQVS